MVNSLWVNIFKKEQKQKDVQSVLAENYLFEDLSKKELQFLEGLVHVRSYRPSEIIFRQGEVGIGMFIVMNGQVDISVEDPQSPTDTTNSIFVTQLEAGDFLGENALVEDNSRRSATATARTNLTLIGFFKPDLLEVVERRPQTGAKILFRLSRILSRRLKETAEKVAGLKSELQNLQAHKD